MWKWLSCRYVPVRRKVKSGRENGRVKRKGDADGSLDASRGFQRGYQKVFRGELEKFFIERVGRYRSGAGDPCHDRRCSHGGGAIDSQRDDDGALLVSLRLQGSGSAFDITVSGTVFIVAQDLSPFGAGWSLSGLDRLVSIEHGCHSPFISAKEGRALPGKGWSWQSAAVRVLLRRGSLSGSFHFLSG